MSRDYSGRNGGRKWLRMGHNRPGKRDMKRVILIIIFIFLFLGILFTIGTYWWRERRWRFILLHHSAADIGNLKTIRKLHIEERGWPDIAYHFVINNGSRGTTAGEVEISNLWKDRSPNLSTQNNYINRFGIAIVLVGNFEKRPIPELQRAALIHLLARLMKEHKIPINHIIGHRDVQQTACPGKFVKLEKIREEVRKLVPF